MKDNTKNLYLIKIPPVSREYAQNLAARYPAKAVSTTMTLPEIHDHAGEQRIISLILAEASGSEVISTLDNTREVTQNKITNSTFWNRLLTRFTFNPNK